MIVLNMDFNPKITGYLIHKLAMLISEAKIHQGNSFEQIFFQHEKVLFKFGELEL